MAEVPVTQILLADDSADDVLLLKRAFRKAGATSAVHAVADGVEALAYLQGEGVFADRAAHPFPDLLLLDLNMPRMNGLELLGLIRAAKCPRLRRLPVYVLTASNLPSDVERVHDLLAHGYVVKPNRVDDLVAFSAALHQWLRFTTWPPRPKPPTAP